MSQNIDKSMAYIMNDSGGDFQQDGCLYKPTSGIQWTPKHFLDIWQTTETSLRKADQLTFVSSIVVIS